MTPAEALRAAAALIEQPGTWTQHAVARDARHRLTSPKHPRTVRWDAFGALCKVTAFDIRTLPKQYAGSSTYGLALAALARGRTGHRDWNPLLFVRWHDRKGRTAAEVAAAMRQAAERLEARP